MTKDSKTIARELRARADELDKEARALRAAAHHLDPRGRKPGTKNRTKEAPR